MTKLKLYKTDWIMNFVEKKITMFEQFSTGKFDDIPYCDKETRWEDDPIFKVCKLKADGSMPSKPRSVPKGSFDNKQDAVDLVTKKGKGYGVHSYPSKPTFCLDYCPVAQAGLCDYGKLFKANKLP
jgi:hypothetical protein